jgi:DNA (cytosine-5)-methyltransferase 1
MGYGYTCAFKFQTPIAARISCSSLKKNQKPPMLEVFAGCRGLGLGFDLEGCFETTHAVEVNRSACDTIQRNAPHVQVWQEDVVRWLKNCKDRRLSIYPKPHSFPHIHWAPPCNGCSDANRNGGMNVDYNNSLTLQGVECIRLFLPFTLTMEQVVGILKPSRGRRNLLEKVIAELVILDYQVRPFLMRASDYGEAQKRDRVVLFGAKRGFKLPDFPKATHADNDVLLSKVVTAKDVLGILEGIDPVPENGW